MELFGFVTTTRSTAVFGIFYNKERVSVPFRLSFLMGHQPEAEPDL
jgi:hypothetical protein